MRWSRNLILGSPLSVRPTRHLLFRGLSSLNISHDAHVLTVSFANPKKKNAWTVEHFAELWKVCTHKLLDWLIHWTGSFGLRWHYAMCADVIRLIFALCADVIDQQPNSTHWYSLRFSMRRPLMTPLTVL